MKHPVKFFVTALMLLALVGCKPGPGNNAYQNIGPQSLLDVSSEVVNLSVANKSDTKALSDWIAKDAPTRAQLFCTDQAPSCKDAQRILERNHVAVTVAPSSNNTVTLVYERILAHDCSARYTDPYEHWDNASEPSFGCATSANMVQQVSDKREFISPNLSDDPSAVGAVNTIIRANTPLPAETKRYSVGDSLTKSSGSGGGGGGG